MNPLDDIDLDNLTDEQQSALSQLADFATKLQNNQDHAATIGALVKNFNKQSYYLRAGLLGRQYLQSVPNFRKQMELDLKLADIYEACNGKLSEAPVAMLQGFITDWLLPAAISSGCLKAQRSNRRWPTSYGMIEPEEKSQLVIEWLGLATKHTKELTAYLADHPFVESLTSRLATRAQAGGLTPQVVLAWINKEEKVTQATGIKDYAVNYLNLCFHCYAELGEWDSLAKFFDPKGEAEAEDFAEMDREIADFAALLNADGLISEL